MTDNKTRITPPPHLMLRWQEEARDEVRDVANHFDRQSIQMIKAASWGWQQRDASVATELQEARDEELEACDKALREIWQMDHVSTIDDFLREPRAARRPKPPSLKEQALETIVEMANCMKAGFIPKRSDLDNIRRAIESLPD